MTLSPPLLPLATALASVERRPEAAAALARAMGAEALLVFVLDSRVDALVPALGFPQTIAGGPDWERAFALWRTPGEHVTSLAYPTRGDAKTARAWVAEDGTVFLLLGGTPSFTRIDEIAVPLLGALFRSEQQAVAAHGEAEAAREAAARAETAAAAFTR